MKAAMPEWTMSVRSISTLIVATFLLTGCAARVSVTANLPTFNIVGAAGTDEPLGETSPAEPRRLSYSRQLRVVPASGQGNELSALTLLVGTRQAHAGQCSLATNCTYAANMGTYLVRLADLKPEHNDPIFISATTTNGAVANGFLQAQRPWAFSGFSSPVLLRASGTAAGFKLENLAPSIAAGLRRNFDNPQFRFVSINGVVTVYSLPDDEYALAVGGLFDLGGYFQIGPTYHLKNEKLYVIIGTRPEVLFGLIPRLRE